MSGPIDPEVRKLMDMTWTFRVRCPRCKKELGIFETFAGATALEEHMGKEHGFVLEPTELFLAVCNETGMLV